MRGGRAVEKAMRAVTFDACGLIFELAFEAARRMLTQQVFALTVSNVVHGRTAGIAAVRSGRTGRFPHGFVTAGAIAKNCGMFFCCVTTRGLDGLRRGLPFLQRLGRGRLPFASLPFRLGMPPASFSAGTEFLLPFGRLPTAHFLQTFRFSAVSLVVPPRLKSPAAIFVETISPPQPPAPGGHTALIGMLNLSHGSC